MAQLMLRGILSLPEGILLRLAGGAALEIDGRRLDPRMQFLATQLRRGPSLPEMTPAQARAAAAAGFKAVNAARPGGVAVEEEAIPGPGGALPVRHYRPQGEAGRLPGLVYFHMGGWVIGDLDTCDSFCALIAKRAQAHVMSVDYRLAPEHKFPAAMEDAIAAYEWLRANAAGRGVGDSIGVGGDSAGGCMSAVVCQEVKRRGGIQPAAQLLIYPATDLDWQGGSLDSCAQCPPLTREIMEWFGGHWLNESKEAAEVMASPLRSEDLSGLAPAIVVTAGFDVLRDQGRAYADKLAAAGVAVDYVCEDRLAHAFTAYMGVLPGAGRACEAMAGKIGALLTRG